MVENQIEAVAIEAVGGGQSTMSVLARTPCQADDEAVRARDTEHRTGMLLRDLKAKFPHLRVAYLYTRAYGG